jgi:hypothetical protein
MDAFKMKTKKIITTTATAELMRAAGSRLAADAWHVQ